MGTLATGPSIVKPSGVLLSDYISKNPGCLGDTITEAFKDKLPFLFKVLSVNQSLSIQAHPNKVSRTREFTFSLVGHCVTRI